MTPIAKSVKVLKVTRLPMVPTVYDVTVPVNSNLFVCSKISEKSVLAHNCSRDNPKNFVVVGADFDEDDHKKQLAKLKRYDRHFGVAISFTKIEEIKMLAEEKPCKSLAFFNRHYKSEYSGCPLADSGDCWSSKLPKVLKTAFANRKCIPLIPVK